MKFIKIGKEVKLSLFTDDKILNKENPKDTTRKLLELINESGKVSEYKVNRQKYVAILDTNNKLSEREINENPIYHYIKKNKTPRNEQPQETRDLYTENYETLMNEIKDDTNRWKDISCCWMRK